MVFWIDLLIFLVEFVVILILGLWLLPVVFHIIAFRFDATFKKKFQKYGKVGTEHPFGDASIQAILGEDGNFVITAAGKVLFEGGAVFRAGGKWYTTSQKLKRGTLILPGKGGHSEETDALGAHVHSYTHLTSDDGRVHCILSINVYKGLKAIAFDMQFPLGLKDTRVGNIRTPCVQFPCFENKSACQRLVTWRDSIFCPASYTAKGTGAPLIFFDHALNSVVCGPASNHLVAMLRVDDRVRCGIEGLVQEIPVDYKHETLMLFGKGINDQLTTWAHHVRTLNNWIEKDPSQLSGNPVGDKIGVFWGNGAHYYYNKDSFKTYEEVIENFFKTTDTRGIPLAYAQLDSWHYVKTTNAMWKYPPLKWLGKLIGGATFGGTLDWVPDPAEFPHGLDVLMKKINRPYAAHNRWWSALSPRILKYEALVHKNDAIPMSLQFWDDLFTAPEQWGLKVYQQDWVKNMMGKVPEVRSNVTNMNVWMDAMHGGAAKHNVALLYCMSTPSVILNSMKYGKTALLSRASGDYNARWPKKYPVPFYTQSSMLCFAAGLGPYLDGINTSTARTGLGREKHPDLMLKLVNLGTGPVPAADKEDAIDKDLLMATCLGDGTILKADKPLTPLDMMFVPHRKPYLLYSFSKKGDRTWHYIMSIVLWPRRAKDHFFALQELGLNIEGSRVIYAEKADKLWRCTADEQIVTPVQKNEHEVFVIAPELLPGVALIGLKGKYVPASNRAIPRVEVNGGTISVTITAPPQKMVTLLWYVEKAPAHVRGGLPGHLSQIATEHRLDINVEGQGFDTPVTLHLTF